MPPRRKPGRPRKVGRPKGRKPAPRRRRRVAGRGLAGDLGKILAKELFKQVAPAAAKAVKKKIFGKGVVLAGGRRGRGLKLAGQGHPRRRRRRVQVRRVPQFMLV